MNNCPHLIQGQCGLNRYEQPTNVQCAACMVSGQNKQRGLGDTIALTINKSVFRRLKKKGCGCASRQAKLNRIVKYGNQGQ